VSHVRLAIFLVVVAASLLTALPAQATFPGKNGEIAFDRAQGSTQDSLYTVEPDGSGIAPLPVDGQSFSFFPSWSPDGTEIAFTGNAGAPHSDIYVENADGSGQKRLTDDPGSDQYPSWSPNGTKIAFVSNRDGYFRIYVMNADGSGQVRLTANPTLTADSQPAWSPDGTKIAFVRGVVTGITLRSRIFVMNADGTHQTELDTGPFGFVSQEPGWSPDGTKITYFSDADGGSLGIFVMNSDGTGQTRLTDNPQGALSPAWSPDGTKIVFSRRSTGIPPPRDLFVMNADGSGQAMLTATAPGQIDGSPDWQAIPGPDRSDFKNSAQFCKAEQAFWGDQFASRYGGGANAYGKCVSQNH
jgi:Tol biopolymer transport system component